MSWTFKVKEQDIKNVEASVRSAFEKAIRSKQMLNEVGQVVVEDVVEQTRRREKSIPNKLKDLKLLKESWIRRKTKLAQYNNADPEYQEGRSNLTFTGQLLNSFKWAVTGPGKLKLFFDGIHKPYKDKDGKAVGKPITNEELAGYVAKQGRPFVGVRPVIERRIGRIVRSYVRRALKVAKLIQGNVDN